MTSICWEKRLQQAQIAYDEAYSKFSKGKGNVIRQAEMLKHLGVKPTKTLSQKSFRQSRY